MAAVVGVISLNLLFSQEQPQPLLMTQPPTQQQETSNVEISVEPIIVEIKGAIQHPGIYELPQGSRLYELIEQAGGLLSGSDSLQINQAALLVDEQSIYIPLEGEKVEGSSKDDGLVNINQADATELQTLPGIGPAKAQAIMNYRETTPFESIEQLNEVDGIGDKTLEQLAPLIKIK